MELVPHSHPLLYTETIPFDFENPPLDPEKLFRDLKEAMLKHKGVGLSANQVGLPYRVFVYGGLTIHGVFNPKIVYASDELDEADEACLSFPGLVVPVRRSRIIRVRYSTYNDVVGSKTLEDIEARIFQHEMDHMLGRPFFHNTSKLKLDMAFKKCLKKNKKNYKERPNAQP